MPRKQTPKDNVQQKKGQKDEASDSKFESIIEKKPKALHENEKTENQTTSSGRVTRSMATGLQGQNYQFYKNQISSSPNGDLIDNIHKNWFGEHNMLEMHHGYIQWIFPVFESAGMNWRSSPLSKAEAKLIREDLECAYRVIKSYRLMVPYMLLILNSQLNFYGLRLVNEETGEVDRDPKCWKDRYRNLSVSSHNYLRITRILMSLGQMGFRKYKEPLVKHFTKEVQNDGPLKNCERSLEKFWLPMLDEGTAAYRKKTLENDEDRTESVFFKTGAYKPNAGAPNQDENNNNNNETNDNNNDVQEEEKPKQEAKKEDKSKEDAMDIEKPKPKGKRKSKY